MPTSKTETILDWLVNALGLAGGIPAIAEKIGKLWGNIPEPLQKQLTQKMPGFLGLSYADEQIFNALVGRLDLEKQQLLMNFLYKKCKEFQRNRFTNIVAGMEVVQGAPTIVERTLAKDGKVSNEKTTIGKDAKDLRLNFLDKFAEYIKAYGLDEAYFYCIGGRIILENPFHQKAITEWREDIEWFEKTIRELRFKISRATYDAGTAIEDKTANMPKFRGYLREIFGDFIGGFLEKIFC